MRRSAIFLLIFAFFSFAAVREVVQASTWENNANGQSLTTPCGQPFQWPDNNDWEQSEIVSSCTIGDSEFSYTQSPSNWSTLAYPDSPTVSVEISGNSPTDLSSSVSVGSLNVSGDGTLRLRSLNSRLNLHGSLQNSSTIQGLGRIVGRDGNELENDGTLAANVAQLLRLEDLNSVNRGEMKAESGGTLIFDGGTHQNAGVYESVDSTLRMQNGSRFYNGHLSSSGTGRIEIGLRGGANDQVYWAGTIRNDANVILHQNLVVSGNLNLEGSGSISADDSVFDAIVGDASSGSTDVLTIGSEQTITGNHLIGNGTLNGLGDDGLDVVNNGVIVGNLTLGLGLHTLTNNNRIVSEGDVFIRGGNYINNGTFHADGRFYINDNARIQGGNWTSAGKGDFLVSNATLDDVTIHDTPVQIANVEIAGDVLFAGIATVVVDGLVEGDFSDNNSLTIDRGQLLQGEGRIAGGFFRELSLINFGTISATDNFSSLTLEPDRQTFTNYGVLQADGGQLQLRRGSLVNNGQIRATGSNVSVRPSASITGRGEWLAINGNRIFFQDSTLHDSRLVDIQDGILEVSPSSMIATDVLSIGENSRISIDGEVRVKERFVMASRSNWEWDDQSELLIVGGVGGSSSRFSDWTALEIGGEDFGVDPDNHVGAPQGFTNENFYIPQLVVDEGAHAFLVDAFQNAGDGQGDEALYIGHLVFNDDSGTLNLNGLHLYYDQITGDPEQIVDIDLPGDFDSDGSFGCSDIDELVRAIVSDSGDLSFDMNADEILDEADITEWLNLGGISENGRPFSYGDANLDGLVDVADFNVWNQQKFTESSGWCDGDFNADGFTDVADFNLWNGNKFTNLVAVPEPAAHQQLLILLLAIALRRRRAALHSRQ